MILLITSRPKKGFSDCYFQMFPENVLRIIRKFADDLVGSLQFSLKKVPDNLLYVKMKREFIDML